MSRKPASFAALVLVLVAALAFATEPRSAAPAPAEVVRELFTGNDRFVADRPAGHHFFDERRALAATQHPKAMVLSCSDSRLPPELIFDQSLGELFVVRTAGNVADALGIASLEYGAAHLGSRVLVVLGHENCGAVKAAAGGLQMPSDNVKGLIEAIEPALKPLRGKHHGEALVHHAVEAHVDATADRILDQSPVLRQLVERGELVVLQAVYDLESGHVRQLQGAEHAFQHARGPTRP